MLLPFLKFEILNEIPEEIGGKKVKLNLQDIDKDLLLDFLKEKYPEKYSKAIELINQKAINFSGNNIKSLILKDIKISDALELSKKTGKVDFLKEIPNYLNDEERNLFLNKILPNQLGGNILQRLAVSGSETIGKVFDYLKEKDVKLYDKFPALRKYGETAGKTLEKLAKVEEIESAWGKLGKPLEKIGGSSEVFKYFNPITPEIRGISEFLKDPSVLTGIGALLSGIGLKQLGRAFMTDATRLAKAIPEAMKIEPIQQQAIFNVQKEILAKRKSPTTSKILDELNETARKIEQGENELYLTRKKTIENEIIREQQTIAKVNSSVTQENITETQNKVIPEGYLRNPEKFVDDLVKETDKNILKTIEEIKTSQVGEKITSSKPLEYYEFFIDQNAKIMKFPPLYRFYSALSSVKWEAARRISDILEEVNNLPKPIKNYANTRIYLMSLLEDVSNNIYRGISKEKLLKSLENLENSLRKIGLTNEEIVMYNAKIEEIAKKMSDVGLEILAESGLVSEKVLELLSKKKYYFPYFKPEILENLETGVKINLFAESNLAENLATGFLEKRKGGYILPNPDVFDNFVKGVLIKVYTKEKFKAIQEFIKDFAIRIDDDIIELTPEKAENLSKVLNVPVSDISLVTKNPEALGLVKIDLPVIGKNGKTFKKFLVPKEVADYLLDRHNSLTMSTIEKATWNFIHLFNQFSKDQMLALNPKYYGRMIFRDIFTATLTALGDISKPTGDFYRFITKAIGIKEKGSIADSILRPVFDTDTLLALIKVKSKELTSFKRHPLTQVLGEAGYFSGVSHFPYVKKYGLDFNKLPRENILDVIKRNFANGSILEMPVQVFNNALEVGNHITSLWDEFYKSFSSSLRLVPKEIKLTELIKKIEKMPEKEAIKYLKENLIPKILENEQKLYEFAINNFKRDARSMLKGVSIDFERFGAIVPRINFLFYFLNPRIQSWDYFYHYIKTNPLAFSMRMANLVAAISSYYYFLFKIDEENKKMYGDKYISMVYATPQYFATNLPVYLGTAEYKNGVITPIFMTVPFGEYLTLFTIPVYLKMYYSYFRDEIDKKTKEILDKDFKKIMTDSYVRNLHPDVSAILSLPLTFIFNKRFSGIGLGTDIVPEYLKDLEPEAQYTPERENIYRLAGRIFKVSPEKLEAATATFPILSFVAKSKITEDLSRAILKYLKLPYREELPTDYFGDIKDTVFTLAPFYRLKPEYIKYTQERLITASKELTKNIRSIESDLKNSYLNILQAILINSEGDLSQSLDIFLHNLERLLKTAEKENKIEELKNIKEKLKRLEQSFIEKELGKKSIQKLPNTYKPGDILDFVLETSLQRLNVKSFTPK